MQLIRLLQHEHELYFFIFEAIRPVSETKNFNSIVEEQKMSTITIDDIDHKLIEKLFINAIMRLTNEKF